LIGSHPPTIIPEKERKKEKICGQEKGKRKRNIKRFTS